MQIKKQKVIEYNMITKAQLGKLMVLYNCSSSDKTIQYLLNELSEQLKSSEFKKCFLDYFNNYNYMLDAPKNGKKTITCIVFYLPKKSLSLFVKLQKILGCRDNMMLLRTMVDFYFSRDVIKVDKSHIDAIKNTMEESGYNIDAMNIMDYSIFVKIQIPQKPECEG